MNTNPPPPPDYAETFRVRGNEVDYHGRGTCAALANWMMEAAGVHAELLGISMASLHAANLGWVLSRMIIDCEEMPQSEEKARLRTWPSRLERLQFRRDFRLSVPDGCARAGRTLANAVTFWVIMDMNSRRLTRMPPAYAAMLDGEPELALDAEKAPEKSVLSRLTLPLPHVAETGPGSLAQPAELEELGGARLAGEARILTRRADLDVNRHVNTVRYVEWIAESAPQSLWENYRLRRLEVLFRSEMSGGTAISRCAAVKPPEIQPEVQPEVQADERAFVVSIHTPSNGNNGGDGAEREVLRALACWSPVRKS